MPYIKAQNKLPFNESIDTIVNSLIALDDAEPGCMAGTLNYIISTIIDRVYRPLNYSKINEAVGMLECCKQEFYAIVARKYEDKKRDQNGNVYNTFNI